MSHPFRFRSSRFLTLVAILSSLTVTASFRPLALPAGQANAVSQENTSAQEDTATAPCGCTSVMAGRLATTDGSTITSHTCDGGSRTWIDIVPHGTHPAGEMLPIWNKQIKRTEFVGDMRGLEAMGEIPQVPETYQFVHPVYPSMNEYQLAMGETTIGGRRELRSSEGIFSIEELQKVVMARTRTAREAILMMGSLAEEYGYVDTGECLTVIDPREAWFFEIFGPGNGIEGARTARPTTYPGTDAYARLRVASWGLEVHSSGNLRLGGHHEAPPI